MNMEGCEQWSEERWEEYEHDRWEMTQELGNDYYKLYKNYMESEDKEEVLRGQLWREEEEIAKNEYFRVLEEEDNKGTKEEENKTREE